jgi:hypothetical protein
VAGGPGQSGTAEDWQAWWNENQSYLFFSDTGGFVWQIDPLSKKRGVQTQNLRGIARATKPAIGSLNDRSDTDAR